MTDGILNLEDFSPHVDSVFTVRLEDGEDYPLRLDSAESLPTFDYPGRLREAFHLMFHGPGPGYLPQQTYLLRHESLGDLPIGLVVLGHTEDGKGFRYQALFN